MYIIPATSLAGALSRDSPVTEQGAVPTGCFVLSPRSSTVPCSEAELKSRGGAPEGAAYSRQRIRAHPPRRVCRTPWLGVHPHLRQWCGPAHTSDNRVGTAPIASPLF